MSSCSAWILVTPTVILAQQPIFDRQCHLRYIADRFLPDKAIDLVDEAAAKLKMEITSKPESLDEIDRKVWPQPESMRCAADGSTLMWLDMLVSKCLKCIRPIPREAFVISAQNFSLSAKCVHLGIFEHARTPFAWNVFLQGDDLHARGCKGDNHMCACVRGGVS